MRARNSISILILIVIVCAGFFLWKRELPEPNPKAFWKTYTNTEYGVSFRYPPRYFLEAGEVGEAARRHFRVALTEDTEENRLVREGNVPGREGPVTIEMHMYRVKQNLHDWLVRTADSNFKLSDGTYASTSVASTDAIFYKWSGLYQADTVAVLKDSVIYSMYVTYSASEDQIRKDFYGVIPTVSFRK